MKFDFGFSMYFLDGSELGVLEKFFIQVQQKLLIYKRHTQTTVNLYQEEFKERLAGHQQNSQEALQKANEAYSRYYEEIDGDDYDKHSFAAHESGIDEIRHHFAMEEEALKQNFVEMADHYNKSALSTLYALMEAELRRYCAHLQTYYHKRISLERFEQGDYFRSIVEYFDQVIELNTASLQPYLTRLVTLQYLRNKIMHNGGEFPIPAPEFLEGNVKTSDGGLRLEELPDEALQILRVKSKYVIPYYELIGELFKEMFRILHEKEGCSFLSGRLAYLFRFLAPDCTVTYLEQKAIKAGTQYLFRVASPASEPPFSFLCKYSLSEAAKDEVVFTDQLENSTDNLARLMTGLAGRSDILQQAMAGFTDTEKSYRYEFLLYPED
jgi:hypothetical protein